MAGVLAPTLRELKTSHPLVDLVVAEHTPDDVVEGLQVGSLDVGLLYDYPAAPRTLPAELTSVEIQQEPWELVTPLVWGGGHALRDLADHDWVVGARRRWRPARPVGGLRRRGLQPARHRHDARP